MVPSPALAASRWFRVLVFLLPLHTLYLEAWVSWKPWLVLVAVVALLDLWEERSWPWSKRAGWALAVFLAAIFVSWPGAQASFWRLGLALVVGGLLLLVTGRHARHLRPVLGIVFWSAAAMAVTGIVIGLITNGLFGHELVAAINDLPGINRVNKPAYVSGFVALTNWHQDPGYAALWTNVWFVLAGHAWLRGVVRAPAWLGPVVLGGLAASSVLTLSRTGWFGLAAAIIALLVSAGWRNAWSTVLSALAVGVVVLAAMFVTDAEGVGNDMSTSVWFRVVNLVILGQIEVEDGEVIPDADPGDNRLEVWSVYWERFVGSPIRGIGLGTGWAEEQTQEPHSLWLQLLGETGLVGLAGFVFLVISVASTAGRPDPVAASALAVVALATLAQTILFEPILWFALGLWLAQARGSMSSPVHMGEAGEARVETDR